MTMIELASPIETAPPPTQTASLESNEPLVLRAPAHAHLDALEPIDGSETALRLNRSAVSDTMDTTLSRLDVWSDDRPSLRSLWLYAVYGQWTGERTPARVAGVIDAVLITLPVTAVGYLLLWVVERPARRIVAAVLTALLHIAL